MSTGPDVLKMISNSRQVLDWWQEFVGAIVDHRNTDFAEGVVLSLPSTQARIRPGTQRF